MRFSKTGAVGLLVSTTVILSDRPVARNIRAHYTISSDEEVTSAGKRTGLIDVEV